MDDAQQEMINAIHSHDDTGKTMREAASNVGYQLALQEVEKFVEGIDPRQAIITLGEHSGTLLHAKYYQDGWNAALQAILTHIQEMKGEL